MGEWKEYKLGELVEITNRFAFKSEKFLSIKTDDSLPVIKIKNVANGDVHLNECMFYKYDESLKKYIIDKNDILIALTGNHPEVMTQVVGEASRYKLEAKALLNQRVAKIEARKNLDNDFLYYFLKDDSTHDYLASQSGGSANQANISKGNIEDLTINCPSLIEQRTIASILSSLDDKIDLLHRQNKTLEALAETLFRQWFVEEAEESWEEKSLFDLIEIVGGGTPKTEIPEYWDGEINWMSGKDITENHKQFIINTEKNITAEGLKNSSTKILPKFASVVSARGTVGKICILSSPMAFSQTNYGVLPKIKNCYFFTYLLLSYSIEELQSASYGSVFDTITTNTFKEHKINIPEENQIIKFDERVSSFFNKMNSNINQIHTLTQLRDTLLPKLMSGEVRVKN